MTSRLALVALTMSVAAVSARPAGPQVTSGAVGADRPPSAVARAKVWRRAVLDHRPGELDGPARAVERWTERDLIEAAAAERTALGNDFPELNRFLTRAALLHADIAILHRDHSGYHLPSNGATHSQVEDGQQVGNEGGIVHWSVARSLLNDVRPRPSADGRVRLWYQATSVFLQRWNEYYELEPHLKSGLELFPADPRLLLVAGTMHEGYAEPRIQRASGSLVPLRGQVAPFGSASSELREAERAFRAALAADPGFAEARIRLGRVLGVGGRHVEAVSELLRALGQPLPELLQYYALILVGREQVILGQPAAAERNFHDAVALYPGAQSPRLGLSQIARDRGDQRAALDGLSLLIIPAVKADRGDPYWAYVSTHEPPLETVIAGLRRELAR